MLYNITWENYLLHLIDHCSKEELLSFKYVIVSGYVFNGNRMENVTKSMPLYPLPELLSEFKSLPRASFEAHYHEMLREQFHDIHLIIMDPITSHHNVLIVWSKKEEEYLYPLLTFLKNEFNLPSINLNQLFERGYIDPIEFDLEKISEAYKPRMRKLIQEQNDIISKTSEGRRNLLSKMSNKEKKRKLKSLGIKFNDNDNLDNLLIEGWVNDEDSFI